MDDAADAFTIPLSDGERVGRIHIRDTADPAIARTLGHLGYAVNEEHRRRGYAVRALRLLLGVAVVILR